MKKINPIDIDKLWVDRSYLGGMIKIRLKDGSIKDFSFRHFNVYRSLHYFSKPLCRFCDDPLGEEADISIGDIFTAQFRNKDTQHSAVLVRTEAGEEAFGLALKANAVVSVAINPEEIFKAQQRVLVPSADLGSRYYACKINGYPAKKIENGRFRLRSFLTYSFLHFNSKLSHSDTWLKILPWIPKPVLYFQIAVVKLINHSLKPGK